MKRRPRRQRIAASGSKATGPAAAAAAAAWENPGDATGQVVDAWRLPAWMMKRAASSTQNPADGVSARAVVLHASAVDEGAGDVFVGVGRAVHLAPARRRRPRLIVDEADGRTGDELLDAGERRYASARQRGKLVADGAARAKPWAISPSAGFPGTTLRSVPTRADQRVFLRGRSQQRENQPRPSKRDALIQYSFMLDIAIRATCHRCGMRGPGRQQPDRTARYPRDYPAPAGTRGHPPLATFQNEIICGYGRSMAPPLHGVLPKCVPPEAQQDPH